MEWWEKENAYEQAFLRGRVSYDLWKYIPDKLSSAIHCTETSTDGYFIYLNYGWRAYDGGEDCGIIHEYTIADLKDAIKTIRKVG